MNEQFGPAISTLLEESPVRHIWGLSFLVNFYNGPLYDAVAKRYEVSRPEFQILYSLSQRNGLLAQDICLVTGQPKNTISRAVSLLEKKKYVRRTTRDDDKRAKTLELTRTGRKITKEIFPNFIRRQDLMRAALNKKEKETFDKLLRKMVFSLPEWVDVELD